MAFWIAINGSSCTLCPIPSDTAPQAKPCPEYFVGFSTLAEAKEAQRLCLNDPIPVVQEAVNKWYMEGKIVPCSDPETTAGLHDVDVWQEDS